MECTWLPFLLVIIDTSFVIYDNQPSSANNIVVALEEFLCHYLYQICCSFVMAKRIWNPGYVHITLPALTKKYGCYASRLMARRVVWELTREACERPAAAKGTLFSLLSGLGGEQRRNQEFRFRFRQCRYRNFWQEKAREFVIL